MGAWSRKGWAGDLHFSTRLDWSEARQRRSTGRFTQSARSKRERAHVSAQTALRRSSGISINHAWPFGTLYP